MYRTFIFIFLVVLFSNISVAQKQNQGKKMEITIQSSAFNNGGDIPSKYTCDEANISPKIFWTTEVQGIKTFALIMEDPDAPSGTFIHWVVYNIPVNVKQLIENTTPTKNNPSGALMGTNSAGRIGYMGPCPPSGIHRYFFRIYGLDRVLRLEAGAEKDDLLKAMKGHILAEGELMGRYSR